jgi:hypothetical protein
MKPETKGCEVKMTNRRSTFAGALLGAVATVPN